MSTRVFLVRHGATGLAGEDRFAGTIDVALSDLGSEQVRRLSRRLAPLEFAAVYASPLGRTMETARILAESRGLPVIPRDGLREISHGHWEGMTRAEVERTYREEYARWERDPYTFAPAGGETGLAVTARALPALLEIVAAHPDQHVLVVSHKATVRLLVSALLGLDPRLYRDHLDQSPGALNIIDFKDSMHARLTLFNDTSHDAEAGLAIPAPPCADLSKWWDSPTGSERGGRPRRESPPPNAT
jgi:probable phosphoglycerate mutase